MKLPRPGSILLGLILICSVAGLLLYETGHLPYRVYVVHTGSMYPTIPSESAVIVREDRYRVGEVVSFTENREIVSHRLMAIKPDGTIVTKGDANRTIDPWRVPASNIIGGVVAAPRHLGYLLTYVKTPEGGASILIAFLCLWQIWGLAGEVGQAEAGEGALNAGVAKMRGRPRGGAHGWLDRPPFPVHWRR